MIDFNIINELKPKPRKIFSSTTALCALALRSASGPALQAAALECLPTCFFSSMTSQ